MRYINPWMLGLVWWLTALPLVQAQNPTQQLRQSQQKWLKLAQQNNFNYSFDLLGKARGRTYRTRVVVKQDKVVGAVQIMTTSPGASPLYSPLSQRALKRLLTLSQVYQKALDKIVKEAGTDLRLHFNKKGLLAQAGYERVGCKGDCYEGYRIDYIRFKKFDPQTQLIVSWSAWATMKEAWNNQYVFITKHERVDKALFVEKTMTVRDGKIIKVVEVRNQDGNASRRLYTRPERSKVAQMDEIYQHYFKVFAKPPAHNQQHAIYLNKHGLIASIGAQIIDCTLHCFEGFSITSIRKW